MDGSYDVFLVARSKFDRVGKEGAAEATRQAAQLQHDAAMSGIDELRRQFDTTTGRLTPFFAAGLDQLGNVVQGSTAGGRSSAARPSGRSRRSAPRP